MLEGIGKIGDYANLHNLKIEAKYRIKTGQDMKKQIQKQVQDDLWKKMTKVNKKTDEARIAGIKQKLRSGKELSASEMKYLKDTDEDLYNKAKKAQESREELRDALKRAKTKSEARMALVQAQAKVATESILEAKNGSGAGAMAAGAGASAGAEASGVANPGGDATGAASMDASADMNVAGDAGSVGSDGATEGAVAGNVATGTGTVSSAAGATGGASTSSAEATNGATGEAKAGTSANGTESVNETNGTEDADAAHKDGTMKIEHRAETLKNLEQGGDGSKGMDFDTKFTYMLRALQDEWNHYAKDKAYQELPEDEFEAAKEPQKQRHLWDPKRKNDLLSAADAYHTAENLMLSKTEAEGTTTDTSEG